MVTCSFQYFDSPVSGTSAVLCSDTLYRGAQRVQSALAGLHGIAEVGEVRARLADGFQFRAHTGDDQRVHRGIHRVRESGGGPVAQVEPCGIKSAMFDDVEGLVGVRVCCGTAQQRLDGEGAPAVATDRVADQAAARAAAHVLLEAARHVDRLAHVHHIAGRQEN
eukprot:7383664-Prymnesium_polylepis.1